MKYVFVTWAGGGNVPPALGIADQLRVRGEKVRFLGHQCQRAEIEAHGFEFEAYSQARAWSPFVEAPGLKGALGFVSVFTDRGMGRDFLESVAREPADVIVIDCMLLAVQDAAKRAGMRYSVLMHTLYPWLITKWSRGPVGAIAAAKRLRPRPLWAAADLALVTSLAEFAPVGAEPIMSNVRHTGPIRPSAATTAQPARGQLPRVLVSLSTIYYEGQREALTSLIDALSGMDVEAIVTCGDSVDPDGLPRSANVEVCRRVEHEEVLPTVSLAICHGGHGTAMAALAHGVPLLIMPMNVHLDHRMIGELVERAGAGRVIGKTDTPDQLRLAIDKALHDPELKAQAGHMSDMLRRQPGAAGAAEWLGAMRTNTAGAGAA